MEKSGCFNNSFAAFRECDPWNLPSAVIAPIDTPNPFGSIAKLLVAGVLEFDDVGVLLFDGALTTLPNLSVIVFPIVAAPAAPALVTLLIVFVIA